MEVLAERVDVTALAAGKEKPAPKVMNLPFLVEAKVRFESIHTRLVYLSQTRLDRSQFEFERSYSDRF